MVNPGQVAGYQIAPFQGAHAAAGLYGADGLFVDADDPGLAVHVDFIAAVFIHPFRIFVPSGNIPRVVGRIEDGPQEGFFAGAHFFDNPLPQGTAAARVVAGFYGVGKAHFVGFLFHRHGHQFGTAQVSQHLGAYGLEHIALAAGHGGQQADGEGILDAVGRVVALAVGQFVPQDEGHFIFVVVQGGKQPDIDGHIVAQGAVGVKILVVVYKIVVGLFGQGGIFFGDDGGKPGHHIVQHGVVASGSSLTPSFSFTADIYLSRPSPSR